MRTISRNMLRDVVTLYAITSLDRDRKPTYSEPYTLKNVYVEGMTACSDGASGKEPQDAYTLYIEPVHCIATHTVDGETVRGLPAIVKGLKVVYGGLDLFIKAIEPPTAEKSFYKVVMV